MLFDSVLGLVNDVAIDLGTANTLVYVKGTGRRSERALRHRHRQGHGGKVVAVGTQGQGDARPDTGRHQGPAPDEGRRDRRLRGDRGPAAGVHSPGPETPAPRPAAHGHLRALGHHRGRATSRAGLGGARRGAGGLPRRRADRRRHRRRAPGREALRQHGRRHRRRNDRDRRHRAVRHRQPHVGPRRRRRDGRGHHEPPPTELQPAHRRADGRADQDPDRIGLSARRGDGGGRARAATSSAASPERSRSRRRRSARRSRNPSPRSSKRSSSRSRRRLPSWRPTSSTAASS